jgi:hypothetical protein
MKINTDIMIKDDKGKGLNCLKISNIESLKLMVKFHLRYSVDLLAIMLLKITHF